MKPESTILTQILALSNGRDLVLWRQQSGIFHTREGNPLRVGTPGMPDVFGEYLGRAVWIEVKNEKGTLRPEQRQFLTAALCRGTMAFCSRSPQHVLRMLNGPTGWQDWEAQANVAKPVFEWGPAKYLRQTKNESPTAAEYHAWLEGVCGL